MFVTISESLNKNGGTQSLSQMSIRLRTQFLENGRSRLLRRRFQAGYPRLSDVHNIGDVFVHQHVHHDRLRFLHVAQCIDVHGHFDRGM